MIRLLPLISAATLLPLLSIAQLELPVGLVLNGTNETDRQITGLADPLQSDAAVSVEAARSQVLTYTPTTGTDVLVGTLMPTPPSITPGMSVTIVPQDANAHGASLQLNGSTAHPIVKWGGLPVDSADLPVGMPSRLLFDGTHYQLITTLARPCPTGSRVGGTLFCIEDTTRPGATFFDAVVTCNAQGGRLCSPGEWASACRRNPLFLPTVVAYEWADDAANHTDDAKTMGGGNTGPTVVEGVACEYGDTRVPTLSFRFRCCFDR